MQRQNLLAAILVTLVVASPGALAMLPFAIEPANGGHGSGFDRTIHLGQHFASVPSGTITRVCFYLEAGSGDVEYGLAVAPGAQVAQTEHLFTGRVVAVGGTMWTCENVVVPWTAGSLFIHRTGGSGAVGYRHVSSGGNGYDGRDGAWVQQPTDDRAYRVEIALTEGTHSKTYRPPEQGRGGGFDETTALGQLYADVDPGVVTAVCFFIRGGGDVEYGLALAPGPTVGTTALIHEGRVQGFSDGLEGWACEGVVVPWPSHSLFIQRTGGTAAVGYRQGVENGNGYDGRSGTWIRQPTDDRAYAFAMQWP